MNIVHYNVYLFVVMDGSPMTDFDLLVSMLARTLRAHRESRGLSLGALAEQAGISKTSLSNIEAGQANPSLEVLASIARALNIPVGLLLNPEQQPALTLVRHDDGQVVTSESGLSIRPLALDGRGRRSETYELRIPAGAHYRSEPHLTGTEELVICIEGTLSVGPLGQELLLEPWDALRFPADLRHSYASESGARALCVMSFGLVAGAGT
jgi:XRE family transcriptional regulator, regulator of sulfur utilization